MKSLENAYLPHVVQMLSKSLQIQQIYVMTSPKQP